MKRFRLSVCKGPSCRQGQGDAVAAAFRQELSRTGLGSRCEVYRGGCYGLCHLGPNVVIREDTGRARDPLSREDFQLMGWAGEAHYGCMSVDRVAQVVTEHIGDGKPVQALLGGLPAPKKG